MHLCSLRQTKDPSPCSRGGLSLPIATQLICLLALLLAAMALPGSAHAGDVPPNDLCATPQQIADGVHDFTTVGAFTDGPDTSACSTFGSEQIWNDVWYEYTAPIDGILVISTCSTVDFDTRIAIYTGTCGDLVEHDCNDDGPDCTGYSSYLLTSCEAGVRYLVRIGSYSETGTGSGSFGVKSNVPCDIECPDDGALETEACSTNTNGGCRPEGVFTEPIGFDQPICGTWFVQNNLRDTDYYSLTVPETGGILDIDLLSNDEVVGYVYLVRDACPPYVIDYSYGGCPTFLRSDWLDPGQYRIVVAPGFGRQISCDSPLGDNDYTLGISLLFDGVSVPENDQCSSPQVIANGSQPFSTLLSDTDGPADSDPGCSSFGTAIGSDIWFDYTASCAGEVTVSLCQDTDYDSRLEVWEGGCAGQVIACNDDTDSCSGFASEVTFDGQCGVSYLIRVAGYAEEAGTGMIEVSCAGFCDCNGNGVPDQEEIDRGDVVDCDANGIPDSCQMAAEGTLDCDQNGHLDLCDILSGVLDDVDGDLVPDICQCDIHPQACCQGDLDGDGVVSGPDLSLILGSWGTSAKNADLDGDGVVGGSDLALVLGAWGDC